MKAVILGNSGSGKTWLACRLAEITGSAITSLDDLYWQPGGFERRREPAEIEQLIQEAKSAEAWIVEGVFGDLAERFLDEADLLLWLDLDWPTCRRRLEERAATSRQHMGRQQTAAGLAELIAWAAEYDHREGPCSRAGHRRLFESFPRDKARLTTERQLDGFLDGICR